MTGRLRSLHVGLNYPGTSAELSGCVNDAYDFAAMFDDLGYSTTVLLEPPKHVALATIGDCLGGLGWSDRFVLTWSGHGSYVPDRDGDEADGFDEVLCPSDYTSGVITDDELHEVLSGVPLGVRRTILSDTCHSGSVNRFAPDIEVNDRCATPRFLPPSEFLTRRQLDVALRLEALRVPVLGSRPGALLISGCDDHEYSYDAWFGGRANGAFTRNAIDSFRPSLSMAGWYRAIRERLPSKAYPQTPQLQGRWYQRRWKL
jgi:hypothetical protein